MCGAGNTSHAKKILLPYLCGSWNWFLLLSFQRVSWHLISSSISTELWKVETKGQIHPTCSFPYFSPVMGHIWSPDFPARQVLFLTHKYQCLWNALFIQASFPENPIARKDEIKKQCWPSGAQGLNVGTQVGDFYLSVMGQT